MSKIALEGNSLGSGTFTIAAPNSNSNPTLTLPTSSGTVVVTGGAQTIEFAAGSAASPSITFTGDTNTGIFSPGADTIAFSEGGAEAMRIDSSGNVGIGTTSPTGAGKILHLNNSGTDGADVVDLRFTTGTTGATSGDGVRVRLSNAGDLDINNLEAKAVLISTQNTERMRIDSSGNVGIGTSSPQSLGTGYTTVTINGTNGGGIWMSKGGTAYGYLYADSTGAIFQTPTTTPLIFQTNNTERARITSGGSFGIGTSTPGARFQVLNQITITGRNLIGWIGGASGWNTNGYEELGVGYNGIRSIYTGGDNWALAFSTGTSAQFAAGTQSERARIDSNGYFYVNNMAVGGTANLHWSSSNGQFFVTSSSRRFKHDITDYDKGLAEVMQMRPKYFVYNEEPSQKQRVGFIAEDFHDLGMTEFVEYWKDENDQDTPSEIGYSNMVAILVKSIQELKAITDAQATRIEALEAEVAALKGQ